MRDNFVCYSKEEKNILKPNETSPTTENSEEYEIINKIAFEDTRSILKKVYLV